MARGVLQRQRHGMPAIENDRAVVRPGIPVAPGRPASGGVASGRASLVEGLAAGAPEGRFSIARVSVAHGRLLMGGLCPRFRIMAIWLRVAPSSRADLLDFTL